jgi:hypothetical protein
MKLSMRTVVATTLAAAMAVVCAACGKSTKAEGTTTTSAAVVAKGASLKGSCDLRSQAGTCSEETGASDPMGLAKGLCDALKGVWSEGPCPTGDVVGTCLDKDGSTTAYYAGGAAPRDLDDAKSSCETISEGKFTAVAAPKPTATASATGVAAAAPAKPGGGKPTKKK